MVTTVVSTFTAYYVNLWSEFFPSKMLTAPLPSFDGRAVMYPSERNLRDYMSWRQVDCMYNLLSVKLEFANVIKATSITYTTPLSGR